MENQSLDLRHLDRDLLSPMTKRGLGKMAMDISKATAEDFDPYIGQAFTVTSAAGAIELRLDNVKRLSEAGMRDNAQRIDGAEIPVRRPFALTFEGPREPVLGQSVYTLTAAGAGEMTIMVVPFRQDATCTLYESVFN